MQKEARAAQHKYGVQRSGIRCSRAPEEVGTDRPDRPDRADGRFVVLLLQGSDSAFHCSTR